MRLRLTVILGVLIFPLLAQAQPLADRVPADAILYVGWQGTDSLGPGYDKSHLKAVLDSSNLPQLLTQCLPQLLQRLQAEDPQSAQQVKAVADLLTSLFRYPSAIFFAGIDFQAPGMPRPKLVLLCRAGQDGDAVLAQFNDLIGKMQGSPFPVQAVRQANDVVLTLGYEPNVNPLGGQGAVKPISSDDRLKQALAQVNKDPVAIVYVDAEALQKLADQTVEFGGDPNAQALWPKIRDASGLAGAKRLIWTAGFDDGDWSTQTFLAAPAPRAGLLALVENKPVSDDALRLVPQSATWMTACRIDLARITTTLRTVAGGIDPQAQQGVDMALGVAQLALALNLQKDLFEPLGDEWVVYNDANTAGQGPLGTVLVNRLRKPAEAQRALSRIELFTDNMVNAQLLRLKLRLSFEQVKIGDLTVHYAVLPLASPSWAIKDGNLYVAMYPQAIIAATAQAASTSAKSILDNEGFQALRKRLGVPSAASISFMDLPKAADQSYQKLLLLSQFGLGAADMAGIKTPPVVIPPLAKLKENLAPAGCVSWTDDVGWHMKTVAPFPFSRLLGLMP